MQPLTLLIASIASILVLFLSPIYGLIVYIATISLYPEYLTVPVGTIDFTVGKIAIVVIFAKLFLLTDLPNRFKFIWLDKIVIMYFIAQIVAGATNPTSLGAFLENRAGAVFNMVLPYFAVRMIVRNKQQYLILLKWILIIAAPLAIVGFYECLTGNNPVGFLRKYNAWRTLTGVPIDDTPWVRYGFFRANVTFSHPIMYGLFFATFCPACAGILAHVKKYKMLYWTGLGLMGVGVFSSMSAGPWLTTLLVVPFIAFYRWRKYWKPVVISIIVICGLVEIISNRHFYDVLSDFSFNTANAWYRSRLIDVALFEGGMSGHWLFGYNVDPGWGRRINGLPYTDFVNQYLAILGRFGLVSFLPFLAMNVAAIKKLVDGFKVSFLESDRWLIWCLAAVFFGLAGAFMTVSIYGPPATIYYMMIAFAGVIPAIVTKQDSRRKTGTDATLLHSDKSILLSNGLQNNS